MTPHPDWRCPQARKHAPLPDDVTAEDMNRTHVLTRCPVCGEWVVWKPRLRSEGVER